MSNNFRVNEKTRTVRAYNEDVISDEDFKIVERYTKLGYKVILKPSRPKEHKPIKNDMIKYLEKNIDKKLYDEFIDRVEKGEKFLITRRWLERELKNKGINDSIEEIITRAKSKENNIIEKAKEQASIENDKKNNKNETKDNENE